VQGILPCEVKRTSESFCEFQSEHDAVPDRCLQQDVTMILPQGFVMSTDPGRELGRQSLWRNLEVVAGRIRSHWLFELERGSGCCEVLSVSSHTLSDAEVVDEAVQRIRSDKITTNPNICRTRNVVGTCRG
jgi:hypothetical protein